MDKEKRITAAISGAIAACMTGAPPAEVTGSRQVGTPHQAVSPWRILARQQLVQRRDRWQSFRNSGRNSGRNRTA